MQIHRRAALVLSFLPFVMIGLIALWYAWVNFKANRAVDAHLAWMESQGYPTLMDHFYPEMENPDNAMMHHPAMIEEMDLPESARLNRLHADYYGHRIHDLAEFGMTSPRRNLGERPDVRTYFDPVRHETAAEAARELLDALAPELARLDVLVAAFARPDTGWTITREDAGEGEFDLILMGKKFELFRITGLIGEIAQLHIALGDPDAAAAMVGAILDFHRHLTTPPLVLLDALISSITVGMVSDLIQDGIAGGVWKEPHLAHMEERLAKLSPESAFVDCLPGEQTHMADYLRQMRHGKGGEATEWLGGWELDREEIQSRLRELWIAARPRGIMLLDAVASMEMLHQEGILHQGKPRTRFEIAEVEAFDQDRGNVINPTDEMRAMAHLILHQAATRYFEIACTHTLLRTGIALERHRLAHGAHPETLAALAPEFLTEIPADPCDGGPLRYRRQADGSPLAWSIGIDGIDEGGKPHQRREKGDRVWATAPIAGFDEDDWRR